MAISRIVATKGIQMADDTDTLLKIHELVWGMIRQMEDQRAQITNIVLLIASAIIGFIAQKGLSFDVLPLTILLIALGIYGALVSEKMYERFWLWRGLTDAIERKLDKLHPGAEISGLWQEAQLNNAKMFPRLNKIHLHHLWMALHLGIAIAGVILTLFIVLVPRT